jgi:hypothetical protein
MRSSMKSWAIALALVVSSRVAHADPCQAVSDEVASDAATEINEHREIVRFCEPCGDKAPGVPEKHVVATTRREERGWSEVVVNGKPIDLAYTFVRTNDRTYDNLAALVSCDAPGVSRTLRIEDATPDGVLIVADPAGISAPSESAPAPAAVVKETPIVTLPPQLIVVQSEAASLWPGVLAGGGGASAVWAAWALMATRRRRRAMRPRAAELVHRT